MELFQFTALAGLVPSLAVAVLYWAVWQRGIPAAAVEMHRETRDEYWRFGTPRTLTCFLDAGIVFVGPWLLRHQPGQTGALLLAMTVVRAAQAALAPISQVIGLGAARMIGRSEQDQLSLRTRQLFGGLFYLGVLGPCLLSPWSKPFVAAWLPDPVLEDSVCRYLTVLIWGMTPLSVFSGLRGLVDMRWTIPLNLFALSACIATQFVVFYALQGHVGTPLAVSIAMLTGLWALGILTVCWVWRDLRSWHEIGILQLLPWAAALWSMNTWLAQSPSAARVAFSLLVFLVGTAVLWKLWPPEFLASWKYLGNRRQSTAS